MNLWQSAAANDRRRVVVLYKRGIDINSPDKEGLSPLHHSVKANALDVVKCLVQKPGIKLNAKDPEGQTPLHLAVDQRSTLLIKWLTECGCDPNAQDNYHQTALHRAVSQGQCNDVRLLLSAGAKPGIKNKNGWNALHVGCYYMQNDVVAILIKYGVDLNTPNQDGWTALHCAVMRGSVAIVRTLLEGGANPDYQSKDGSTPLHFAVLDGKRELTETLLQLGARSDVRNHKGQTPFDCAHSELKSLLQEIQPDMKLCVDKCRVMCLEEVRDNQGVLVSFVGQKQSLVVHLKNDVGTSVNAPHNALEVRLLESPPGVAPPEIQVNDLRDGHLLATWLCEEPGEYLLGFYMYNQPLPDSPMRIIGKPHPSSPRGRGGNVTQRRLSNMEKSRCDDNIGRQELVSSLPSPSEGCIRKPNVRHTDTPPGAVRTHHFDGRIPQDASGLASVIHGKCVVCNTALRAVVLHPCNHLAVCVSCAVTGKECPVAGCSIVAKDVTYIRV